MNKKMTLSILSLALIGGSIFAIDRYKSADARALKKTHMKTHKDNMILGIDPDSQFCRVIRIEGNNMVFAMKGNSLYAKDDNPIRIGYATKDMMETPKEGDAFIINPKTPGKFISINNLDALILDDKFPTELEVANSLPILPAVGRRVSSTVAPK